MDNLEFQKAIDKFNIDVEHFLSVSEISRAELDRCIKDNRFPSYIEIALVFYIENIDKFKEEIKTAFFTRALENGFIVENGKVVVYMEKPTGGKLELSEYEKQFVTFRLKNEKC